MLCALLIAWGFMITVPAQDYMRRTLMAMPDSIMPLINHSMMGELVEFAARGGAAEVKNKLDGMTSLDSLTNNYASFTLTKADKMQLMLLQRSVGDTIICLVRSFYGPEPESQVQFFSLDWKSITDKSLLPNVTVDDLLQKPDTMTEESFQRLKKLIDPCLVFVSVYPQEQRLSFSLSKPLLSEADKKALDAIILQKSVKWDGKTFE